MNKGYEKGIVLQIIVAIDHGSTRTCNPQIRSLMPYPLGHAATYNKLILQYHHKTH
jgi:hypothetical protein